MALISMSEWIERFGGDLDMAVERGLNHRPKAEVPMPRVIALGKPTASVGAFRASKHRSNQRKSGLVETVSR